MAKAGMTRVTIPKPLLDAKNSAAAEFISPDTSEVLTAFLARPNPQHNVVGVGDAENATIRTAANPARSRMPLLNARRSPRVLSWRGR